MVASYLLPRQMVSAETSLDLNLWSSLEAAVYGALFLKWNQFFLKRTINQMATCNWESLWREELSSNLDVSLHKALFLFYQAQLPHCIHQIDIHFLKKVFCNN